MDPNLHQKQGINHMNKILAYAPMVEQEGKAVVHLTPEDWHVVADTLFNMNTPGEMLPEAIDSFSLANENRTIRLETANIEIDVDMIQ